VSCAGVVCALLWACSPTPAKPPSSDSRVRALADDYLNAFFDRSPEWVTIFGIQGGHHNRLTDNSLAALKAWEAREDAFLAQAKAIDPRTIENPRLRATYAITREALESSVASRVCRFELWNVSQMNGWHTNLGYLVTIQPVGSDAARQEALARWRTLPQVIDTEIANLREGIRAGYTAPKVNVRIVIDQVRTLAKSTLRDSPFDSPAQRDSDATFKPEFDRLVTEQINLARLKRGLETRIGES